MFFFLENSPDDLKTHRFRTAQGSESEGTSMLKKHHAPNYVDSNEALQVEKWVYCFLTSALGTFCTESHLSATGADATAVIQIHIYSIICYDI